MTDPIYAIGDVHGQLEKLLEVIARIEADGGPTANIVFLGDLVDRGPDSSGVIELVINARQLGKNWQVVKGNHDRMFQYFMEDTPRHDTRLRAELSWMHPRLGGRETLASYGVDVHPDRTEQDLHAEARAKVPQSHMAFIESLPFFHQVDNLLFVHAGIRPGIALPKQSEDDLCWIRDDFLNYPRQHPWLVVHGHTVVPAVEHRGNRVNLDTGAGYGNPISAVVFEGDQVWRLGPNGRELLTPAAIQI
ncbi:serine/threonine protein phosphatase [Shimia sp. R10_1]|uniref:metallophosphoesterase family protein n=1 Tax=Shimia sp. R10_1 TaxID=2821095 RepID=UPI001ADA2D33|nr:metallophosphoesterase family protein [Shimia sp. R10_1]MBO9473717.1 serine/threonine protein phosphatase [Shimia sp. R10_1]